MVLLAVFRIALPALPISIFGAVPFFFITRYVVEEYIGVLWNVPIYV